MRCRDVVSAIAEPAVFSLTTKSSGIAIRLRLFRGHLVDPTKIKAGGLLDCQRYAA